MNIVSEVMMPQEINPREGILQEDIPQGVSQGRWGGCHRVFQGWYPEEGIPIVCVESRRASSGTSASDPSSVSWQQNR